jgi:hypothetical protein
MDRLARWFGRNPRPVADALADAAAPPRTADGPVPQDDAAGRERDLFAWLVAPAAVEDAPLAAVEQDLLGQIDLVLGSEELRAQLLPRARSIVPQLLHSLRDETQSARALAARVGRDPNLVVEVIRMANSVAYRGGTPIVDLMQAITRLGTEGVRRAVAKVLLKPIFDAQGDPLLARSADRLWQQSEIKASVCLQRASRVGVDPFEAYLAGLMHNVGWTAVFRAIDRSPAGAPERFSAAFVPPLVQRRDRLFALLVGSWELSETLSALAQEVSRTGLAGAESPLARMIVEADAAASRQVLGPVDATAASTEPA